jgi:hypothetical protein
MHFTTTGHRSSGDWLRCTLPRMIVNFALYSLTH